MHVKVNYTGQPGAIHTSLTVDGKPIDTTIASSHRAGLKWAKRRAKEYKREQTVKPAPPRHDVFITLSGEKSFNI
jgi:hypothetical protein